MDCPDLCHVSTLVTQAMVGQQLAGFVTSRRGKEMGSNSSPKFKDLLHSLLKLDPGR